MRRAQLLTNAQRSTAAHAASKRNLRAALRRKKSNQNNRYKLVRVKVNSQRKTRIVEFIGVITFCHPSCSALTIGAMSSQAFFSSPEDCARAFYEAFARAEIDAVMATWAEDEDICCVHPAAAPLYGYAAVRAAWDSVFRNSPRMRIEPRDEHWAHTIGMATQTAIEWIYVGEEQQARGPVFVTNTYLRAPQGWRLLSHHASPLQTGLTQGASPTVLH
jgi:ketosteroid isomerase-like protein